MKKKKNNVLNLVYGKGFLVNNIWIKGYQRITSRMETTNLTPATVPVYSTSCLMFWVIVWLKNQKNVNSKPKTVGQISWNLDFGVLKGFVLKF